MEKATESLKLNVGCGTNYLYGYINIDNNPKMVADEYFNIERLPYAQSTVDEIFASHIIEHFDIHVVPYLLADWITMLKPGAKLVIETPHIKKAVKKLDNSAENQITGQLRFLYGINYEGNSHKSGFTPYILKTILKSLNVSEIKILTPKRYKIERSFRIECIKNENERYNKKNWLTRFISAIWRQSTNKTSLFFNIFYSNVISEIGIILNSSKPPQLFTKTKISWIIARIAIFEPSFSPIFLKLLPSLKPGTIVASHLAESENKDIPVKIALIWEKSLQKLPIVYEQYLNFLSYWTHRLKNFLTEENTDSNEWQYWNTIIIPENREKYHDFGWDWIQIQNSLAQNRNIQKKNKGL